MVDIRKYLAKERAGARMNHWDLVQLAQASGLGDSSASGIAVLNVTSRNGGHLFSSSPAQQRPALNLTLS